MIWRFYLLLLYWYCCYLCCCHAFDVVAVFVTVACDNVAVAVVRWYVVIVRVFDLSLSFMSFWSCSLMILML